MKIYSLSFSTGQIFLEVIFYSFFQIEHAGEVMSYSILVVDDHVLLRKGIKSVLQSMKEVDAIVEANDGFEAIEAARKQKFDLVLLDISMPGKDGIDTLKQLKYEFPELIIMMLSMYPEKNFAIRTLKAGASGYLEKNCDSEELTRAVRKVISNGKYISQGVAFELIRTVDTTSKASYDLLSDREVQVLCLLTNGEDIQEIADQLSISNKTVSTHKARLLHKLDLKNTAELVRYAIENNLS